jgi:SAM-dependent methyltransferase
MRRFDYILQEWRARMARPWIPAGANVLDIGCFQGEFLQSMGNRIGRSIGIDPLARPVESERIQLLPELFREPMPFPDASFDAIVMLATLEHIQDKNPIGRESYRLLRSGGRLIITVPSKAVDHIMDILCRLRIADGLCLEEHHGYDPNDTPRVFAPHGFALERSRRFQLGLNHLFVLSKRSDNGHSQSAVSN